MQISVNIPTPPTPPTPPGAATAPAVAQGTNGLVTFTIVGTDGKKQTITIPRSLTQAVSQPPQVVNVAADGTGPGIAIGAILAVVVVAFYQRFRGKRAATQQQFPADATARFERLERGVEAIAIEVERISEGQRFVTKLMSEQKDRQSARLEGNV